MTSEHHSDAPCVVPLQETVEDLSDLGVLQFLPSEIRLLIYTAFFLNSNPTVDINVEYNTRSGLIVNCQMIHHGDEILHTSKKICKEAFPEYWPHVATISASRTIRVPSSNAATTADGQPTGPIPVDIGVLVKVLPRVAKDNVLHLKNINLLGKVHMQVDGETTLERPQISVLLGEFKKLETVLFNEYRDGFLYTPLWNLQSRHAGIQLDMHSDFAVFPGMESPQEWFKTRYGIDVLGDPSVSKIHFLKKAVEKRRSWLDLFPGMQAGGGPTPAGGNAIPPEDERPSADAFLNFTNGKSYGREPGLPDDDGFRLLMSWEAPPAREPEPEESTVLGP
ncbi:hypothetical protein N0V93_008707 [Gnomoniopsis smithogilvyi]|uniref:Uncharacterized protein n=1 Tax=Gnomoniopsis smithogilvyi TaxID=1191159 RepID=A0A9W8YMH4_9PEZI|nr:hypothetical protein N0V93_008707 [Gnomoniopsis smithogilvyi]